MKYGILWIKLKKKVMKKSKLFLGDEKKKENNNFSLDKITNVNSP